MVVWKAVRLGRKAGVESQAWRKPCLDVPSHYSLVHQPLVLLQEPRLFKQQECGGWSDTYHGVPISQEGNQNGLNSLLITQGHKGFWAVLIRGQLPSPPPGSQVRRVTPSLVSVPIPSHNPLSPNTTLTGITRPSQGQTLSPHGGSAGQMCLPLCLCVL